MNLANQAQSDRIARVAASAFEALPAVLLAIALIMPALAALA